MAVDCYDTIALGDQPTAIAFHTSSPLLAVGDMRGCLHTFQVREGLCSVVDEDVPVKHKRVRRLSVHGSPCRSLAYSKDGCALYSVSRLGGISVLDVATGKALGLQKESENGVEDASFHRVIAVDGHVFATGDDGGAIQLWDARSRARARTKHTMAAQADFITGLTYDGAEHVLLATSGDGTLAVYDVRKGSLRGRSEDDADDELLSVAVVGHKRKVVVGSQAGIVNLFSWGHWEGCSDRLLGHPHSVDAVIGYDDSTVLTGAGDGAIRLVSILPNQLLGVIGVHSGGAPIEGLAPSPGMRSLASISHDEHVRLWSLAMLVEDEADCSGEAEEEEHSTEDAQAHKQSGERRMLGRGDAKDGVKKREDAASSGGSGGAQGRPGTRKKHGKGEERAVGGKKRRAGSQGFFDDIV